MAKRFRDVDRIPKDEDWQAIHRAADRAAPEFQREFLTAVERAKTAEANLIQRLIRRGDFAGAATAARNAFADALGQWDVRLSWRGPLEAGAQATAEVLADTLGPSAIGDTIRFDVTNPRAQAIVDREAGRLIVDLTAQEEARVNQIISRSFREQFTTRKTARLVKEGLGLTRLQEEAIEKFERKLIESDLPARSVVKRVARRREQMLLRRSRLIARQETMMAANQGTQVMWEQASSAGQIPLNIRRKWIVTPDDRLCPICIGIPRNEFKGILEPFVSAFNGQSALVPPMHIGCRCTVGLVRVSLSRVA